MPAFQHSGGRSKANLGVLVLEPPQSTSRLKPFIQTQAEQAYEQDKFPFIFLYTLWCPASQKLLTSLDHPLMKEAFDGSCIIKLNSDDWGQKAINEGVVPHFNVVPAIFRLDQNGEALDEINGGAWGENVPTQMAPPLRVFVQKERQEKENDHASDGTNPRFVRGVPKSIRGACPLRHLRKTHSRRLKDMWGAL